MRIIRASEINSFLYCRRAWWYQAQGIPSMNQAALEEGRVAHQVHARRVRQALWAIRFAYLLFFVAILILAWMFLQ
jgi:CRISPR/Cas system-associated exonuclease Cas4 (RecB family)